MRMAWHAAYDNLVLHTVFDEKVKAADVRKEMEALDGAAFPAFLPGFARDRSFVFADTLGFHAVGMVADNDAEPKGTLAILHRALSSKEAEGSGGRPRSDPAVRMFSATRFSSTWRATRPPIYSTSTLFGRETARPWCDR